MFKSFAKKFFVNVLLFGFYSLFLGIPVIIYSLLTEYLVLGLIALAIFLYFVAYFTYKELVESSIHAFEEEIKKTKSEASFKVEKAEQNLKVSEHKESLWRASLKERASGFPSLFTNIAYYEKLIDDHLSGYLRTKPHPAVSSSEIVKGEAKRRREAEYAQRTTQALIEYYESIAPFLLDFKEEIIEENDDVSKEYTSEEKEDPVINYLAKDEYRKLPSVQRNQMALERYWNRPKPKWLLGRIYERYVGYLYERDGYEVEYTGIVHGYEDLGRDLICSRGDEIVVIQCKNWSQFKRIYENHIFQFFGTVFQYRDANPQKKVRAIFYTTTKLSDLARRFANELGIELREEFKMDKNYPCIKCNISRPEGTRIYHLPFDQQYDNTKIEVNRGEFYCSTVKEAGDLGFRRAFRWHSVSEQGKVGSRLG